MTGGRRLSTALVLAGLWAGSPALAEAVPPPGVFDARVRSAVYNEDQVYRLDMALRSALEIRFAEGEEVANIALGDSVSWEVAPSGHLLFVKPRETAAPTNLIVATTTRSGTPRSYHFELRGNQAAVSEGSAAIFALRFTYPRDAALQAQEEAQAVRRAAALKLEAQAVSLALEAAVSQGPRNLDYVLAGPASLAPAEVSDNGVTTVLRFPRGQAVPAIYKVLGDGTEALVNFDVRGEFVVIHEVVRQLRLRLDGALVCIWNERGDALRGGDLSSGTVSPDVLRQTESKP